MRKALLFAALTFLLAACGDPKPPIGKWEGALDIPSTMVAARVEIDKDAKIKISAPDMTGIQVTEPDARAAMRARLAEELSTAWSDVAPRVFDFDGDTFRKPGGVAPQMEWHKGQGRMILVVYLGRDPARRIPLRAVSEFSDDPFNSN